SMSVFRVSSVVWVLLSFPTRRSSDLVSWKNVKADQGDLTWDDYLETGVVQAMRVVREISGQARINVLGFCVGGTLLGTAAAVLRSEEHTSELQSRENLVCRLLLEKKT